MCENERALRLKMKALEMSTEDRIRLAAKGQAKNDAEAAYISRATFSPRETCNVPVSISSKKRNPMTPKSLTFNNRSQQSQVNDKDATVNKTEGSTF